MVLLEHCVVDPQGAPAGRQERPSRKDPLAMKDMPLPVPLAGEILVRVTACGICHTELDEIEGRLSPPRFPLIPGHEVVGRVEAHGPGAGRFGLGDRVGIAWIHSSCGDCGFCRRGAENLCDAFQATGLHAHGGYAQYTTVHEDFAYPIPEAFSDAQAAPLLCAGVIGYRALRLSNIRPGEVLGLYGFGASAHIAIQVARHWGCRVFVFTRAGQKDHQDLAGRLGAEWVGSTGDSPPEPLDSAIDFTPVGEPVKEALRILRKGGRLAINAIRKIEPIPPLDYAEYVWHEKEIKSVANVTRQDAREFLPLAAEIGIRAEVTEFDLSDANTALRLLKQGRIHGAAVLRIPQ
ncbi:MAG: zinc-dependent alcohol dehydrogenase family protein [Thermodesulfobacteriota bacterium]